MTPETAEKNRVRAAKWYHKNMEDSEWRERRLAQARKWRESNPHRRMFWAAYSRAKDKGISFIIDVKDVIVPDVCPILGTPLVIGTPFAPSLDRIDNALGYVKGNVQVISRKANRMKADATLEELRRLAQWVNQLPH